MAASALAIVMLLATASTTQHTEYTEAQHRLVISSLGHLVVDLVIEPTIDQMTR